MVSGYQALHGALKSGPREVRRLLGDSLLRPQF